ncbi:MAG: hypothetical protein AAFR38_02025 [Planctomycetota bacterium]
MTRNTAMLMASAIAAPAGADILTFQAFDHPAGNVDNQDYGLRMDGFDNGAVTTFSMENADGSSAVTLTINTDIGNGEASLTIEGTVVGNSAAGGNDLGSFSLFMQYIGTWDAVNELFVSTASDSAAGTLTGLSTTAASPLGDGESVNIAAKADDMGDTLFYGRPIPGSRLGGLDQANLFEAQGWVMSDLGKGTQDFLFVAIPTVNPPAPGAAALIGLGGLVAARRRRG